MTTANLSARAYDEIINDIVMLNFSPGESIQERQLADSLEMSRTPVREALGRLAHEGWLQINSRRNIEVRPLTRGDVEEVFEIRELIELFSIEKVFEAKRQLELYRDLSDIAVTMRKAQTCNKNFLTQDKIFHDALIGVNVNQRLNDFWKRVGLEFLRMGMLGLKGRGFSCLSVQDEHDRIVAALATRRKKDVRKSVVDHLEATKSYLLSCLD